MFGYGKISLLGVIFRILALTLLPKKNGVGTYPLFFKDDKTKIIYNDNIFIENIPLKAYKYIINGKNAIEGVMYR